MFGRVSCLGKYCGRIESDDVNSRKLLRHHNYSSTRGCSPDSRDSEQLGETLEKCGPAKHFFFDDKLIVRIILHDLSGSSYRIGDCRLTRSLAAITSEFRRRQNDSKDFLTRYFLSNQRGDSVRSLAYCQLMLGCRVGSTYQDKTRYQKQLE